MEAVHVHDTYTDITSSGHSYSCESCGTSGTNVAHEIERYARNPTDMTYHRVYCKCGHFWLGDHIARAYQDGTVSDTCSLCGFPMPSTGGGVVINRLIQEQLLSVNSAPGVYTLSDGSSVRILTENGSYVLPDGTIVLTEEDHALMEAGLLDPYALLESGIVPSDPDHVTE